MTIYSQHANRGKVQILATHHGPVGVVSSTVTSVDDTALAARIVDALNRISAYSTVPVSLPDERDNRYAGYPTDHLRVLPDQNSWSDLRDGTHSLWYEQAMTLLHRALHDLITVVANAPAPVKTAIIAELETEARRIREEFTEDNDQLKPAESFMRIFRNSRIALVVFDKFDSGLDQQGREALNELEEGLNQAQREQAVADLRLLLDAHRRCANDNAELLVDSFEISDDPYDEDAGCYFMNIQAPMPNKEWNRTEWNIEVGRWVPENPQPDVGSSSINKVVLDCVRTEPPTVSELVDLLNRSNGQSEVLATWAKTVVGEPLAGTTFIVTKRYEN
ncbi:hypothetical protein [Amycolatopsis sp. Poz14]|uniref:hypothetical protein n=1 Tax=Amycolatopsis sp. Poz14 TaxID=1447705 RepID=UPI00055EAD21|nr:hypothetical protein [Amycolatopsis sp. Poz14]MCG3749768.1 hypothetical protein [Amycolatopsis sp. Poz14]